MSIQIFTNVLMVTNHDVVLTFDKELLEDWYKNQWQYPAQSNSNSR